MFAKLMSISDELMWKYFDLVSSARAEGEIVRLRAEAAAHGRNPRDAKVACSPRRSRRASTAPRRPNAGEADFDLRARGGIPDEIEAVALAGAPLGIGAVLKRARLAPFDERKRCACSRAAGCASTARSSRTGRSSFPAGTFVVQVGKRKFARVTLR